jgi:hypothetical protein
MGRIGAEDPSRAFPAESLASLHLKVRCLLLISTWRSSAAAWVVIQPPSGRHSSV